AEMALDLERMEICEKLAFSGHAKASYDDDKESMAWALFLIARVKLSDTLQRIQDAKLDDQEIHVDGGLLGALQEARDAAEELKNIRLIGNIEQLEGIHLKALGNITGARDSFVRSLASKEEIGDVLGTANSLHSLGEIAMDQNQFEDALAFFDRAAETYEMAQEMIECAHSLSLSSHALIQINRLDEANERLENSLEIGREMEDISTQIVAHWGLADLGHLTENISLELENLQAAVVLFIHLERPVPVALRNRLDEMIDSLDSQE
ncbi:MAG: tetratricopeptide repeat protein, partial [Candidatus Thermoplasmatota archaeon]|nr:tetratricopeptide repeat protein [Candidatus Thermoplasmatota archaeon]